MFRRRHAARYATSERRPAAGRAATRPPVHDRRVPDRPPVPARPGGTAPSPPCWRPSPTDPLLRWVWPGTTGTPRARPPSSACCSTCGWTAARCGSPMTMPRWRCGTRPAASTCRPPTEQLGAGQRASPPQERAAWAAYDDALGVPADAGAALVPRRPGDRAGPAGHRAGPGGHRPDAGRRRPGPAPGVPGDGQRHERGDLHAGSASGRTGRSTMPDGGPACWLMRRDPQEVAS